ncbi:MAG: DUF2974 domain-containing protein [Bacilli bacterium]|nr:DUF2974 domain-containing protein [Bacilli bacterium]
MKSFYDYLKKNKDVTIKEKPWNAMDDLFCACISYIPLLQNFEFKTFDELCSEVINFDYPSKPEYVSYTDKKIFTILKDSKRYHNMCFFNYVKIIDNNTQFGAITITLGSKKVISFQGSDGSMIGWIENLRLIYEYPTYTQKLAIDYLKENVHMFDYNVDVVGHSKGGNLAIVAAMEMKWYKKIRIKKVYNFDGPGLTETEYNSKRYQQIFQKIENYLPNKSYVGTLLYSDNNVVVDTNAMFIGVHYPTNWKINENDDFVLSNLSSLSKKIHQMTTSNLKDLDKKSIKKVLEEIFKVFDERKKEHFSITLRDIHNIIKKIDNAPTKEKEYVLALIKSMFDLSNNKE